MAMILVVEDEVFIRQIAELTIEDLGHTVLSAGDIGEAMSFLSTSQRIDALFVDMRLTAAAHGGCEVANEAIKLRPDLRVLYTSGTTLDAAMSGLFVSGGQFLQKPYSQDQLEDSVGVLLQ